MRFFKNIVDAKKTPLERVKEDKGDPCRSALLRVLLMRASDCVSSFKVNEDLEERQKFLENEMLKAAPGGLEEACKVLYQYSGEEMLKYAGAGAVGAELSLGKPEAEDYARVAIDHIDDITTRISRCSRSGFFPTENQSANLEKAKICQKSLSEFLQLHEQCRSRSSR